MLPENLMPINGQIVVVDSNLVNKIGSFFLPDNAEREHVLTGTVIATSRIKNTDGTLREPEVAQGDQVIYTEFAGASNTFMLDKRLCRIIKSTEILAIVS